MLRGKCDNAPKYVKDTGTPGEDELVLYRCKLQNNQHQW